MWLEGFLSVQIGMKQFVVIVVGLSKQFPSVKSEEMAQGHAQNHPNYLTAVPASIFIQSF